MARHFDALLARFPRDTGTRLIQASSSFCDASGLRDVETFFAPRIAELSGGEHALAEALETIQLCAAQRAQGAPQVTAYLAGRQRVR